MSDEYISVTEITKRINKHLKSNRDFNTVYVKGEVTGIYLSKNGHYYFNLKDENSIIKCVMYYRARRNLNFEIKNGMQLLVKGSIDTYKSQYQILVNSVTEDGIGQLFVALEQLKEKLKKEGLFEIKHKKEIPLFPKKVGVVTALKGAVIRDIIKTIDQRNYNCEIFIFPSMVQGSGSDEDIAFNIKRADKYGLDLLVVGRGGGSFEDLLSFNSEKVVRAVFKCETPVISAVGHQNDTTLVDNVSDVVSLTPTDAANKIINQYINVENRIDDCYNRLINFSNKHLNNNKTDFNFILNKSLFKNPSLIYNSQKIDFNDLVKRFNFTSNELIASRRNLLSNFKSEYVIRHPCKMQLDRARYNLDGLESRLVEAIDKLLKNYKVGLDKTVNNFLVLADKNITYEKHKLDKIKKSYFLKNPCVNQLTKSKSLINISSDKLINIIQNDFNFKKQSFENLRKDFISKANKLILVNSYKLNSIKSNPILKNHLNNNIADYNNRLNNLNNKLIKSIDVDMNNHKEDLKRYKDNKLIKNPYSILEGYKLRLNQNREKLDKIKQFMELERENKKQKTKYVVIIAVVVIIFITIILLLLFGGI